MTGEGKVQVYYGDGNSLLPKIKTENLINDSKNGVYISSWVDYTNWNDFIYLELVKNQAPNKWLF